MLQFSKSVIKAMGFSESPSTNELSIKFGIVRVYSIQGLTFDKKIEPLQSDQFGFGNNCNIVISESINEASKRLTGDIFIEDEDAWLKDNKARPPFVLLYFTENFNRTFTGGHRKFEGDNILIFDGFPEGKKEIIHWEKNVYPA